jgi:serine/threonine-protein kinase RsbW
MAEIPHLRLSLPNRPENVLVVRQALTGVAECLALDAIETNDLNTAVTEACNNVVAHAYGGAEGPLEVEVCARDDGLAVVVRDHGDGMADPAVLASRAGGDGPGGMGLVVIDALSRRVEFAQPASGGTEVRMEFAPTTAALEPLAGDVAPATTKPGLVMPGGEASNRVALSVVPNSLARAVLPRVLSALAARAYFSTDRISDVQLVADVLAAKAPDSISASHLDVGVSVQPRNLELRIGPLQPGHGESIVTAAADGLAPVIERLTDERHRVTPADGSTEMLELRLIDQRR